MTSLKHTAGKAFAAIGIAGMLLAGTAGAALAAEGPDQPGSPSEGKLILHKYLGAEGAENNSGVALVDTSGLGSEVEGVKFKVERVGVKSGEDCTPLDLANTADWTKLPATVEEAQGSDFCLEAVSGSPITSVAGGVSLTLPLGQYLVTETDVTGANVGGESVNIVSEVAPFLVTIPTSYTNEDGQKVWNYDVNVYPKNQDLVSPEKKINTSAEQVAEKGYKVGDSVQYTITQTIPTLKDATETFTSADIYDVLKTDELKYKDTVSVKVDGEPLSPGDYNIVTTPEVKWELTATGLAELKDAQGKQIEVVFNATVLKVTDNGDIANPGSDGKTPGYGSNFNGDNTPGKPTPYTYWGELQLKKVDDSTTPKPLAGAEFKVFAAAADSTCPATAPTDDSELATGVSNDEGKVIWNNEDKTNTLGVFINNSNDGELSGNALERVYCVYETKVPAGYSIDSNFENAVTIKAGTVENELGFTADVKNFQKDVPNLPLTGAAGTMMMVAGGLALVGVGVAAAVIGRKRRQAA